MTEELEDGATPVRTDMASINEGLMLGLVRQHELTEVAERLNAQLREEMAARQAAEKALIDSERLASVGRMAAVLAHEINNPLEAVMNVLFLAQTCEGVPETARKYLETADAELKRVAHITRQTLGFYRESTAPGSFHVAELLASVVDLLRAKQVARRAVIETQCGTEVQMTGYQGEIRQVVSNLFINSLDAIGESGRVTLRAGCSRGYWRTRGERGARETREGPCVRITVSDDGPGIGPAVLPRVFEPFYTTKGSVGNGLGLWVCRQIVEKHGGCMQVRSRTAGPRRGTTFSVVLPVGRVN